MGRPDQGERGERGLTAIPSAKGGSEQKTQLCLILLPYS